MDNISESLAPHGYGNCGLGRRGSYRSGCVVVEGRIRLGLRPVTAALIKLTFPSEDVSRSPFRADERGLDTTWQADGRLCKCWTAVLASWEPVTFISLVSQVGWYHRASSITKPGELGWMYRVGSGYRCVRPGSSPNPTLVG